ncbi:PAS domain-containing sensor histidine kinase [Burkholderiaceae bacterium UC74_6]
MTDSNQSWFGPGLFGESSVPFDELIDSGGTGPQGLDELRGEGFARLYRAFLGARVALGLVLVTTLLLASALGSTSVGHWNILLCLTYGVQALALWLLPPLSRGATPEALARPTSWHWLASIGMDLAIFSLLHIQEGPTGISYSALFVLPMLMAGVMSPRLMALATAALAALVVLGVAALAVWRGNDSGLRMTQAGLVGSGFFVVTLLASEMASRLAREERAARGSLDLARQQAQLNRLVIDEMQEGVLVVDRSGRVRAANPAARGLLADPALRVRMVRGAPFPLRGVPAWSALVQAVEQAFAESRWPEAGRDVLLQFESGLQCSLRLRVRFTRRRELDTSEDLCVLFIEDNRRVAARSQQERLAAMGRMSAGIAHEIRNPLTAIAQANALLSEDTSDPQTQQLTRMVASNVQRLKRIVDDVMEVAPGATPDAVPLDAALLVAETCVEWARTNNLPSDSAQGPLRCEVPREPLIVSFEPEHLRRVLVNLLDNAQRHADAGNASVRVRLAERDGQWASLSIFSAGAPIPAEVERHLFEPFFSTRSRGTGLGLYICRELCERYGARIGYQRRAAVDEQDLAGNEFTVRLRRAASPFNATANA